MATDHYSNVPTTLLVLLGVVLVGGNFGDLLHTFLHPTGHPVSAYHLVITVTTALLAGLLFFILYSRRNSLAKEDRRQLLAVNRQLAASSQAQEEWLQTFNTMPDLVSVHDRDFRIVKANTALCDFLGKKPEEIIGRSCYQLFHDRDTPIEGCPHNRTREIGHAVTMEINDPHLGVPLLVTCSPFVDREGRFAGSVHMARIQTFRPADPEGLPQRFIPICASCKDIRDESGNWVQIEEYLHRNFNGQLTHSICSDCQKKIYPELFPAG